MLLNLIKSNEENKQIGGLIAIKKLTEAEFEEESSAKMSRMNLIKMCLDSKINRVTDYAAKALGSFSKSKITLIQKSISSEMQRAIETLKNSQIERIRGAVLVLHECALNAPHLFYVYILDYLKYIWIPLRINDLETRNISFLSLKSALKVMKEKNIFQSQYYSTFLKECINGLDSSNNNVKHASLLVIGELLRYPSFLAPHFPQICKKILNGKDSREKFIKSQMFFLIPLLSSFDTSYFIKVNPKKKKKLKKF